MSAKHRHQDLTGRVLLVTGGARRIGAAIVRACHGAGARVVVHHHRSAGEAHALADELEAERRGSALALAADLLEPGGPERLVARATERWGRLDGLINNASSFFPTPMGEIDEAQWRDLVGTNLKAPLFLSQAAAPALEEAAGAIVNLVDIHARRPLRNYAVYSVAKAGLVALTRSLARELAPEIRVNAVAPGAILWPEAGLDEQVKAQILSEVPLARAGRPGDIVDCVRYLLGAGYVTGQVIAVDGGRSIGW